MTYRLTLDAERDLANIWDYTVEVWDTNQARAYFRRIEDALSKVLQHPRIGVDRSVFLDDMRSIRVGQHLAFYKVYDGTTVFLRILHQRQNIEAIRFGEAI